MTADHSSYDDLARKRRNSPNTAKATPKPSGHSSSAKPSAN
jgi:hypothetical protein